MTNYSISSSGYAALHLTILGSTNAISLLVSLFLRLRKKRVRNFFEMMTKIILYDVLYIILSTIILSVAIKIETLSINVNNTMLSLIVSIGSGLSWVATLIPIGIIISLIKFLEEKR